jgi:hypothetical protein
MLKIFASLLVIAACTTSQGPKGKQSVFKASAGSGTVSYNPDGVKQVVEVRRENALTKIREACGGAGKYTIISEETRSKSLTEGDIASFGAARLTHLKYSCK